MQNAGTEQPVMMVRSKTGDSAVNLVLLIMVVSLFGLVTATVAVLS